MKPVKRNLLLILVTSLLIALFLFSAAYSQFGVKRGGSMYGFVITQSNINEPGLRYAPLEGAVVEAKGTAGTFKQVTDSKGSFQFNTIPPGDYTVTISRKGYGTVIKQVKILDARVENLGNIALVPDGGTTTADIIVPGTIFIALALEGESTPEIRTRLDELNKLMHGDPEHYIKAPETDHKLHPLTTYENSLMLIPPGDIDRITYLKLDCKPAWLCFNISGTVLYVADAGTTIWIYDILHNNLKLGYIPLSHPIHFLKLSPDGKQLFAVHADGISVIDTKENTVVKTLEMPPMSDGRPSVPWAMACSPDGNMLYVAMGDTYGGEVVAIDAATGQPAARAMTGDFPVGIAITPDGSKLFTTNTTSGNVSVLSTNPLKLTRNVQVGVSPVRAAVTPDGEKVFITNRDSGSVSVLSGKTVENIASINVGKNPMDIVITGDGSKAFVTNNRDGTISIIDVKNMTQVKKTHPQLCSKPFGAVVKP